MIEGAVAALRAGRAVILPTDTVYGLCVLPGHEDVLYELKGRDRSKPVALLAASIFLLLPMTSVSSGAPMAAFERSLASTIAHPVLATPGSGAFISATRKSARWRWRGRKATSFAAAK